MIGASAHGIVEPGSNGGGRFSVDPGLLRCFQLFQRGHIGFFFGHTFRMRFGVGKHLVPFFREFGGVGIDMVGHAIFRDDVGIIKYTMDNIAIIYHDVPFMLF